MAVLCFSCFGYVHEFMMRMRMTMMTTMTVIVYHCVLRLRRQQRLVVIIRAISAAA